MEEPGERPTSPLSVVGPVLVMVEAARTVKAHKSWGRATEAPRKEHRIRISVLDDISRAVIALG